MPNLFKKNAGSFMAGFAFAGRVYGSLGLMPTVDDLRKRLQEVVNGEITIHPTGAEVAATVDNKVPGADSIRAKLSDYANANRAMKDQINQEAAKLILEEFPFPP
jgi:hypothetical protein